MVWTARSLLTLGVALPLAACSDDGGRLDSASATLPTTNSTVNPSTTVSTDTPTGTGTSTDGGTASDSDGTSTTDGVDSITTLPTSTTSTTVGPTTDGPDTTTTSEGPCPEDQIECDGTTAKVCDGMGGFKSETPCAMACAEPLGCVTCVPGSTQCVGQVSQVCKQDGSGWEDQNDCDPVQGLACDPGTGQCLGACADLGLSYIGCDYYPTVLQQLDGFQANPYAVAVANTSASPANVTVTRGGNPVAMATVPANSVQVMELPWVAELYSGTGPSVLVTDGAYRLRSTQPVTVYQFNPLNADVTNDASLLLPVNTWTGNYLVASWPFWNGFGYAGFYAVTARHDNTTVTLKAPKGGTPTQAGGGVDGQGNGVVVLNEGDVIQVLSATNGDETGAIVTADKPVQVFGGHECTQVPIGVTACDHLEESMFPIEALAKEYIVVPPSQDNGNAEKAVIVRIVASEANTTLTFDPDQPVGKVLANAGDFVEIPTTVAKFVVTADKKILVAEYMVGQDAGYGTSDPAMLLAVPTAQFRSNYLMYAQPGWSANFVDILAPTGATVQVDGAAVGNFSAIGATGFSLAHVPLNNGTAAATASAPIRRSASASTACSTTAATGTRAASTSTSSRSDPTMSLGTCFLRHVLRVSHAAPLERAEQVVRELHLVGGRVQVAAERQRGHGDQHRHHLRAHQVLDVVERVVVLLAPPLELVAGGGRVAGHLGPLVEHGQTAEAHLALGPARVELQGPERRLALEPGDEEPLRRTPQQHLGAVHLIDVRVCVVPGEGHLRRCARNPWRWEVRKRRADIIARRVSPRRRVHGGAAVVSSTVAPRAKPRRSVVPTGTRVSCSYR
ncbi:IgGFc-binding protein [Nannocystis sp. RBIL2]|uniref:IgGFc-binding protein n=1 Tax=Nannocystis sp. RBIL2 TaxID=2996788 RepID=UPI0022700B58|nr:IgGFc-binding protein [Nannocystis sp. RBIL2]MCY1066557.1 IgGFc-binding protein [Nannocystis sp. RBIL2]